MLFGMDMPMVMCVTSIRMNVGVSVNIPVFVNMSVLMNMTVLMIMTVSGIDVIVRSFDFAVIFMI